MIQIIDSKLILTFFPNFLYIELFFLYVETLWMSKNYFVFIWFRALNLDIRKTVLLIELCDESFSLK